MHPHPISREKIVAALWIDSAPEMGLHNLRQTLVYARKSLGEGVIVADRRTLQLAPWIQTDLNAFYPYVELATKEAVRSEEAYEWIDAHSGAFLAELNDEWILEARAQFASWHLNALDYLAIEESKTSPSKALKLAEAAIREDPYLDSPRATKIRILRLMGQDARARKEYDAFAALLRDELSMAPSRIVELALDGETESAPHSVSRDHSVLDGDIVRAVKQLRQGNWPLQAVELCLSLVPLWIVDGSPLAGLELLDKTCDGLEIPPRDSLKQRIDVSRGQLLLASGDVVRARSLLEDCIGHLTDLAVRTKALLALGGLAVRRFDAATAEPLLQEALSISTELAFQKEAIEALRLLAKVALHDDDLVKSRQLASQARRAAREADDMPAYADALLSEALAAVRSGDQASGDALLDQMESALKEIKPPASTQISVALSRLREEIGQEAAAELGYRHGIDAARQQNDSFALAVNLTYLGDLLTRKSDLRNALAAHRQALAIRRGLGEMLGVATSLRGLGRCHLLLSEYDQALEHYRESALLFQNEGAAPGYASAIFGMAQAETGAGRLESATRLARRAVLLLRGLSPLARLAIGPDAGELLAQAIELEERLTSEVSVPEIRFG